MDLDQCLLDRGLLQEADLLECVEQQGFMRKNGAVFFQGEGTCNFDFSTQFTAGWNYTFQVPRADFDKTLADAVAARGVKILYGHGVTAVAFDSSRAAVTVEQPDGSLETVSARFVLDCSGYGRVLPRLLTTVMIASAMPAAISPYSMAVAPDSSFTKRETRFFIECSKKNYTRLQLVWSFRLPSAARPWNRT